MEPSISLVEIDGSLYEGGGQILRNSLALSNILRKPFCIKNIRKNRPNPGLNNQLISAIVLMKQISQAVVDGDKLCSSNLYFYPKNIISGSYKCESHTAASVTLMTQSLIPTLIYGSKNSTVSLKGGTLVSNSPPSSSISSIFRLLSRKMGVLFDFKVLREGYFPKGNGVANLEIQPIKGSLQSIELLKKANITKVSIEIYHNEEKFETKDTVKDCKKRVKKLLKLQENSSQPSMLDEKTDSVSIDVEVINMESKIGKGKGKKRPTYAIVFQAFGENDNTFFDCSVTPDEDVSVSKAVDEVFDKFESYLMDETCLDEYHQDQLLIYMALAEGKSRIKIGKKITNHTKAALYVINQFLPEAKGEIVENKEFPGNFIVEMQGIGLKNQI